MPGNSDNPTEVVAMMQQMQQMHEALAANTQKLEEFQREQVAFYKEKAAFYEEKATLYAKEQAEQKARIESLEHAIWGTVPKTPLVPKDEVSEEHQVVDEDMERMVDKLRVVMNMSSGQEVVQYSIHAGGHRGVSIGPIRPTRGHSTYRASLHGRPVQVNKMETEKTAEKATKDEELLFDEILFDEIDPDF